MISVLFRACLYDSCHMMSEWIIIGLGNPGEKYVGTRHNVGFAVVDEFKKEHDFSEWSKNGLAKAFESRGMVSGAAVRLLKPETYMNLSGEAARMFLKSPEDAAQLIVVHDDVDLPQGRMRISADSGSGGHHGVESIIAHVGTKEFTRVRVGISPIDESGNVRKSDDPDFVIKGFSPKEMEVIEPVISRAVKALEKILIEGREAAMNEFNQNV